MRIYFVFGSGLFEKKKYGERGEGVPISTKRRYPQYSNNGGTNMHNHRTTELKYLHNYRPNLLKSCGSNLQNKITPVNVSLFSVNVRFD